VKTLRNGIAERASGTDCRWGRELSWPRQTGRSSSGMRALWDTMPGGVGRCVVVVVVLVTAACGSSQASDASPVVSGSPVPVVGTLPLPDVRTPSVEACGLSDPWSMVERRRLSAR